MFATRVTIEGDLARRVDREARQRDLSPDEVVGELMSLAFAARSFARRASHPSVPAEEP